MTREQNFRTSFISQLIIYSGWKNIPYKEIRKLPVPLFPSFSIGLGKTKYTKFDPLGKAIQGEQDLTVLVYYELPLYSLENAYSDHSDMTNLLEKFINTPDYVVPPVLAGDPCRIDRTMLTETQAPVIPLGDTRFSLRVAGKYLFTIF